MSTEAVSERFVEIDSWSTASAVEAMFEGQMSAVAATRQAIPVISAAAEAAADRMNEGGRLIYAGAGTSGRIAVQDGVELGPTFGWPANRLVYLLAGGLRATTASAEGEEDNEDAALRQLKPHSIMKSDVMVAVAASGRTPFTIAAVKEANRCGALTISVVNNKPSALLECAQIGICAETGGEVIAGSTRMKAGTAQKVILNLLSTAIMIRCGRVYKGRMVDMKISNLKLQERAISMIMQLADVTSGEAEAALAHSGGNIKKAILCAYGADIEKAEQLLDSAKGVLREAIEKLRTEGKGL